jgi:hypothetical protein
MKISNIRTILYSAAKYLGDLSAVKRAFSSGSLNPIKNRLIRRIYGKFTSRGFNFFK